MTYQIYSNSIIFSYAHRPCNSVCGCINYREYVNCKDIVPVGVCHIYLCPIRGNRNSDRITPTDTVAVTVFVAMSIIETVLLLPKSKRHINECKKVGYQSHIEMLVHVCWQKCLYSKTAM